MENLFEGQNLEQQGESSMPRKGKRKMEDISETLRGRQSWELSVEEKRQLKIESDRKYRAIRKSEFQRLREAENNLIASSKDMEMEHSLEGENVQLRGMENLIEGENLVQQGGYSLEDKPETLRGRGSWGLKVEENRLLENEFEKCREKLAEILRRLKGEKDLSASSKDMEMEHSLEGVKQEQHEASEIDEAGNKLKKARGRSSRKQTEKVKDIMNFISDMEPTKEEFSLLLKILSNRTRRAYKKAEKEEYKIRVEHRNRMREVVAYRAEETKRMRNELKEMEAKMNEMVSLKMLLRMEVEKLQLETMHETLLNQLEGKPIEHNFDGLPYTDGGLLPNFTNQQMRELGANETPNTVVVVEASTSSTARNNEENMRLEKQVYELKEYVQALENKIYGHTPCHY